MVICSTHTFENPTPDHRSGVITARSIKLPELTGMYTAQYYVDLLVDASRDSFKKKFFCVQFALSVCNGSIDNLGTFCTLED